MRASTLATFVEVSTLPETTSPLCTTGVLIDMLTICGGAFADFKTGGGGGSYLAAAFAGSSGIEVADAESGALVAPGSGVPAAEVWPVPGLAGTTVACATT